VKLGDEWGFWTSIPEVVTALMPKIGTDAYAVFCYLRFRTNKERGVAWPSYKAMQAETGLHSRKLAAAIRKLEAEGLLAKTRRFGGSTEYRLLRPPALVVPIASNGGSNGAPPLHPPLDASLHPTVSENPDSSIQTEDVSYPKERGKRHAKAKAPPSNAVELLRDEIKRYPAKSWWPEIDAAVTDLGLWKMIVHEWIGRGWNPSNVRGMLDCYRAGGIMSRTVEPKGFAALRASSRRIHGDT
jgi:hypothetical protein